MCWLGGAAAELNMPLIDICTLSSHISRTHARTHTCWLDMWHNRWFPFVIFTLVGRLASFSLVRRWSCGVTRVWSKLTFRAGPRDQDLLYLPPLAGLLMRGSLGRITLNERSKLQRRPLLSDRQKTLTHLCHPERPRRWNPLGPMHVLPILVLIGKVLQRWTLKNKKASILNLHCPKLCTHGIATRKLPSTEKNPEMLWNAQIGMFQNAQMEFKEKEENIFFEYSIYSFFPSSLNF